MSINAKVDSTVYEGIEKITAGGKTVELSEVYSGSKTITANGTHDVSGYAEAVVDVPNQGTTVSGTKEITANGTYDVSAYASALVNVAQETDGLSVDDFLGAYPYASQSLVTSATLLRKYALAGDMWKVTSVTANNATKIAEGFVYKNAKITEVIAPNVTSIETLAFVGSTALKRADYPLCTSFSGFSGCTSLEYVSIPLVTALNGEDFNNCKSLVSVSLPAVTNLRSSKHFYNCVTLKNVELPLAACAVPQSCFEGCTSLEEITLPKVTGVTQVSAFKGCTALKKVDFGDTCTSLKTTTPFANCTALETVILRYNGVVAINNGVFSNSINGVTVYVPSAQISAYQADSVWSTQAKVSFAAIEGSEYE